MPDEVIISIGLTSNHLRANHGPSTRDTKKHKI